jgi:hypothetical protein
MRARAEATDCCGHAIAERRKPAASDSRHEQVHAAKARQTQRAEAVATDPPTRVSASTIIRQPSRCERAAANVRDERACAAAPEACQSRRAEAAVTGEPVRAQAAETAVAMRQPRSRQPVASDVRDERA